MSLEDRRANQEACIRCSQCKFVPMPQSQAFSSVCPSIDHGQFHAYSGGGQVITSHALLLNKAEVNDRLIDSVYSCTMCGGCDTACKTNMGDLVEPLDTLYELRAKLAGDGHVPAAIQQGMQRLRAEGSHLGARRDRSRWAEGLALRDATRERVQVLLYVGGRNAFNPAAWPQLHTLVQLLARAGVNFGVALQAESDAGGYAYDNGFQDDARQLAQAHIELVKRSGASVLLSACADGYAAFRGLYPRLGLALPAGVRVAHSTDFLAELLHSGALTLDLAHAETVTYHDPCRLGRLSEPFKPWRGQWTVAMNTLIVPDSMRPQRFGNDGNYEAPRQLLRQVRGIELVEMERNRQFAYCCGAGAGAEVSNPEMAEKAAVQRLREAQSTGASTLVTACAGCQGHMSKVASRHAIPIKVCGVMDLLATAATTAAATAPMEA